MTVERKRALWGTLQPWERTQDRPTERGLDLRGESGAAPIRMAQNFTGFPWSLDLPSLWGKVEGARSSSLCGPILAHR